MKKPTEIVRELTPELSDKIWKSVQKSLYDKRVSKEMTLHHLKQLKAQMGKEQQKAVRDYPGTGGVWYNSALEKCMEMIDKKIAKIKAL